MKNSYKKHSDRPDPKELQPGTGPLTRPEEKMRVRDWVYSVSQGVSNTILAVLGMGLLLAMLGEQLHWPALQMAGIQGQKLLAPALGMAVAVMLRTSTLVTGASMIAATVGSNAIYFTAAPISGASTATGWVASGSHALPAGSAVLTSGQPISAVLAAVVAAVIGKWLTGKTPLDMVLVPLASALVGSVVGLGLATVVTPALNAVSKTLANTMQVNPILGAIIVSVAWFIFLMTPASSAALAIAVQLDPMSAGAALIGTTVAFVAFAAMAPMQNNLGANIAQTIVTPKIQFPNLLKRPILAVGPLLIAAVMSCIAVVVFQFQVPYTIGGLGLNSFIAPLTLTSTPNKLLILIVFGIVLPAILSFIYYRFLQTIGQTKPNDLHLEEV